MKTRLILSVMAFTQILMSVSVYAQSAENISQTPVTITPYRMSVGYYKTSNIIFPYKIISVDRGSAMLLARKAKGVDNILELKAGVKGFEETNVTVVTSDGKFYSFLVHYATHPQALTLSFTKEVSATLRERPDNEAVFDSIATLLRSKKKFLHAYSWNGRTKASLDALCLTGNLMYLELGIRNFSPLAFKPKTVRFFIRDKRNPKRTAAQEQEIRPVYVAQTDPVPYEGTGKVVFAFKPFTVSRSKKLIIQITGENDQGLLEIKVSHHAFLKEKLIEPPTP